jgi:hypothetical protein
MEQRRKVTFSLVDDVRTYDPAGVQPNHDKRITNTEAYRFGALSSPSTHANRVGRDFEVDAPSQRITSTHAKGVSLTTDLSKTNLTGKYKTIPKGTAVPNDMQIRDDMGRGHATLFNKQPMSFDTHKQHMATLSAQMTPGGTVEKKK